MSPWPCDWRMMMLQPSDPVQQKNDSMNDVLKFMVSLHAHNSMFLPSLDAALPLQRPWRHPSSDPVEVKRNIKRNMMCRATNSAESTQESPTAPAARSWELPPLWDCHRSLESLPGQQQNEHGSMPELRNSEERKTTVSEQSTTKGPPQQLPSPWADHHLHPPRKSWF